MTFFVENVLIVIISIIVCADIFKFMFLKIMHYEKHDEKNTLVKMGA